jgi:hypothetical protein
MVVVATLMGSRCFGGGLAKVGGEPMWAANPLSTLQSTAIANVAPYLGHAKKQDHGKNCM